MEWSQLEVFVAVADELHFGRAAARCHLSQSAVSKQVSQLEREFGLVLFVRDRRSVVLSPDGLQLLGEARRCLEALAAFSSRARRVAAGDAGLVRVGFTPTAPHQVLPGLVHAFRARHPALHTDLQELSSEDQLHALSCHQLDVGILRASGSLSSGLKSARDFEERFVATVSKQHPLAQRKRLALRELRDEPWVLVRPEASPSVHRALLEECLVAGFSPRVVQTTTQVHGALALVASGCGVSVVPTSARHLRLPGAAFIPLRERLTTALSIVHAEPLSSQAARAFVAVAKQWRGTI
jgi:DNA-binding transcriptional LysR family regulator